MRLDENAPAEFLFGHLGEEAGINNNGFVPKIKPSVANLYYVGIGISYVLFVFLFEYFILNFQPSTIPVLGVTLTGVGLILISGVKSIISLKRYGPDLVKRSKGLTKFIITQIFLAYLVSFLVMVGLGWFIIKNNAQQSPITLMAAGVIALLIYTKGISDIGLITAGLGMGIVPSWGGLKNSVRNFNLITNITGVRENQLAVLRLGLWIFTYSMLIVNNLFWVLLLGQVAFVIIFFRWERANSSSIVMRIRGIIQELSPSNLPISPNELEIGNGSIDLESENENKSSKSSMLYGISNRSKRSKDSSRNGSSILTGSRKEDLTPIAQRSINRIVDKIRAEDQEKTPNNVRMYCSSCKMHVKSNSKICIHCSDPLEYVASSQT